MRSTILTITLSAISLILLSPKTSANSTNCKGSSLCKTLSVSSCDAAERTIVAGNIYATNG